MATTDHEGYKKVQVWVPQELWDKIESLNFQNQTIAVTEAFKALLDKSQNNPNSSQEIPELRARLEGKDKQLEEKEKHIETLKAELEEVKRDKEDLKRDHNNYFMQVQTLINQKALEAPGEKKKWWKIW